LCAVLLTEGGFNFFNKWFFEREAANKLYEIGSVPEDQYSKKGSTAGDSKLDNRLTMDLSREFCLPLVTISANADKCYDRINRIIMSLLLLALTGEQGPICSMLKPIQQMKFYQRTGCGDSSTYMGGRAEDNPLQGLCRGTGLLDNSKLTDDVGLPQRGACLYTDITNQQRLNQIHG
jgi:hypothetical protein